MERRLLNIAVFLILNLYFYSSVFGQGVSGSAEHYRDSLYSYLTREGTACLSCRFTYHRGSSVILSDLGENYAELCRLDSFIRYSTNHPELQIRHIALTGYSSIDGRYIDNDNLARDRVSGFFQYLRAHYPILGSYPCDIAWVGEDWNTFSTLLRELAIEETMEINDIIRQVHTFDDREALIRKLNGGRAYAEIEAKILPLLRRVEIEVSLTPGHSSAAPAAATAPADTVTVESGESTLLQTTSLSLKAEGWDGAAPSCGGVDCPFVPYRFSLKTNLLLWGGVQPDFACTTSVANVALEYYINPHWSIEASALYSYWLYGNKQEFQGLSGYSLEPRYRTRLLHDNLRVYLGVYGRIGDYDLRSLSDDAKAYTNTYWDSGLSAGLSFRIVGSLGLEVGARVGYLTTRPVQYEIDGNNNWYTSHLEPYRKVKLTGLNVSVVYKFR